MNVKILLKLYNTQIQEKQLILQKIMDIIENNKKILIHNQKLYDNIQEKPFTSSFEYLNQLDYLKSIKDIIKKTTLHIENLELQSTEIHDKLIQLFQEKKTLEIVNASELACIKKKQDKKEENKINDIINYKYNNK